MIYETYHDESADVEEVTNEILDAFKEKLKGLKSFVISGTPGILRLLQVWSRQDHMMHVFN